jgi:hypothetical protein
MERTLSFAHAEALNLAEGAAELSAELARTQNIVERLSKLVADRDATIEALKSEDHGLSELIAALDMAFDCIQYNTSEHWVNVYPPDAMREISRVLSIYRPSPSPTEEAGS